MARPKSDYDDSVVKKLIVEYQKNKSPNSLVKPIDMYHYALEEYKNGLFPYKLSHDYWKRSYRRGRQLIDEFNTVKKRSYQISELDNIDIVDVQDLIDKYANNPEELSKYLVPMEKQLRALLDVIQEKDIKIVNLTSAKQKNNDSLSKEKAKSDKLQTLLYQLFSYSGSGFKLDNLLNTGTSRTKRVENAFEKAFDDPTEFLELFPEKVNKTNQENIVPLPTISKDDEWDL
ncbi:hypothetical protein J2Z83_002628 [Virgibacillus natechei]|uniref:Uncharacterized protein n=1 Tax=Virgibacillus natechei TaxID=1216297 RepID=A0ABS4IHT2_9BACI|nr:hypothetical protein [Virgibacillus natechei]MBP1970507.1 hypothetical protein [Virgibacillus natechei]UZD14088.1 hypothetical protein OLD84_06100 [Virgibacillus natechei]